MSSLIERRPSVTGKTVAMILRSPHRRSGRRIVVYTSDGVKLYDTDYCYDHANAVAKLDEWIKEQPTGSL